MTEQEERSITKSIKRVKKVYDRIEEHICTEIFHKVIFKTLKENDWAIDWAMGSVTVFNKDGYDLEYDERARHEYPAYKKLVETVTDLYSRTPFWDHGDPHDPVYELITSVRIKDNFNECSVSGYFSLKTGYLSYRDGLKYTKATKED